MPKSPNVNFKIVNNNVAQTTPSLGISCMLARTTKGPVNDPSEIIQGYAHFQRVFGEEVLTEGNTISPVQKALEGGSKLRIIRVATIKPGTGGDKILEYGGVTIKANPTGNGDLVNGSPEYNVTSKLENGVVRVSVSDISGNELESAIIFKMTDNYVDASGLLSFARTSQYIKLSLESTQPEVTDLDTFGLWVAQISGTTEAKLSLSANANLTLNNGETEAPTKEEWIDAFDSLLDYTDVYQVTCSNINHQGFDTADLNEIHTEIRNKCHELQEYTYYIEVPSWDDNGPKAYDVLASEANTLQKAIGYSEYVAYFTGGLKYYNATGALVNTDCIGPIMGLGDTSATNFGPWRSFAGMNRGLIPSAVGPVIKNYGSPSRYEALNKLAENYLNVIVIKDTPSSGKSTMLWHLFTSKFVQDSEKFLAIVRLNLYLKKNLRPLLEKYIEEPNIWSTWMNIYLEAKPILDNLVDQDAISEYEWMGDQNASSYEELIVNNEADVRQGKYKVILKYKDIVPMQDILITLYIDQASKSVSATIE